MKEQIVGILKYNRFAYRLYYVLANAAIAILKAFVRPDEKLILFNSFAGRNYDDSPRAIFEKMREDERFRGYRFVWAFHDPDGFEVEGAETIKTDTIQYFVTALKARAWITNSSVERGLSFKGKQTLYLNTWHGTPIKKMGSDIESGNASFYARGKFGADVLTVQSRYEEEIFCRSFQIDSNRILRSGLPRNDVLANYSVSERSKIREALGISAEKRVILYCPTFREYEKDSQNRVVFRFPLHLEKWKERLGEQYIVLVRAHYEVSKKLGVGAFDNGLDVSDYPNLNELMIASDMLISDYSSVFFDYAIMNKPMFHYTYDYEEYTKKRGLYFDIRKYVSGSDSEDRLIEVLLSFTNEKEVARTEEFRREYVDYYGDATEQAIDCLASKLIY